MQFLRALACSLLVGGGLPATGFASAITYFTGPETEWLDDIDAAPSTNQTLSADRTLRSLKLDAGVDVSQAGFALVLESGDLFTDGSGTITIWDGSLRAGDGATLRIQTGGSGGTLVGSTLVGSGGLVKTGPESLTLSGIYANTYTGVTTVNAGILGLAKYYDGVASVAGDIVVGDGLGIDTLQLHIGEQIADTATVTLQGGAIDDATAVARLDLNGTYYYGYHSRAETIASLVVAGNGELDFGHASVTAPSFLRLDTLSVPPGSRLTVKTWTPYAEFLLVKATGVDPADLPRIVFDGSELAVSVIPYDSDYVQIAPCPVITFPAIPDQTDGGAPLTLAATASAGGPVFYEVVSGFATMLEDGLLRLDHPGPVTVRAGQQGNDATLGAEPVERTFNILPGPRPANDDFADATVLTGDSGSVTGHNRFATGEPQEPGAEYDYPPARSVWWSWTAPADGQASFDNRGALLTGSLEVFAGSDLGSLDYLGYGNNSDFEFSAAVIEVTAGTTYHIRLRGFENLTGDLRLNWTFLTTPVLRPATRITSQGFTASWSGNARSYRLEIFDQNDEDESYPRFTLRVTGATTHAVRGLASDTTYAFRVVATEGADLYLPSEKFTLRTLFSEASAAANDFAYSATELEPSSGGSLAGDNRHATNESFETATPLASVWYRWTPPTTGLWRLRIAATFPADLTLYPDTDLSEAWPLASARNNTLDWETRADTPYLIQVAGQDAAQGTFTLTWELVRADELPANDDFADAAPLLAFPESVTASNRHAGVEETEYDPTVGSLWWRWTAPHDGVVLVSKTSDFDSRLLVFKAPALAEPGYQPAYPYAEGPDFAVQAGVTYYLRIDGQEPAPRGTVRLSLRFLPRPVLAPATLIGETGFTVSWTHAEGPCVLRIYDYLDPYNGNDNAYISPIQTIRLPAGISSYDVISLRPDTAHYYTIATTAGAEQRSAVGSATTLPATTEVPPNDFFGEAAVLTPEDGALTVTNRYASNSSGEADDDDETSAGRASLWYAWTAPTSGEWRFSLAGSAVPAAIEIYDTSIYSLSYNSLIAEASGSPADGDAACTLIARAGETYQIALLGVGATRGDLALTWSLVRPLFPPANDAFENAQVIEGSSGSVPVTLDLASADDSGPYPDWIPTVWLRWQAPATEKIRFALSATDDDTSLSLYTGDSLNDLTEIYAVDGVGSDDFRSWDWQVQAGVVYYLRIQGEDRLGADATLAWSPAPPSMPSPAPLVVTRGARFVTLRLPPRAENEPYRIFLISTHADLSEPLYYFGLLEDAGDYVVSGLLPSTRYYYQLHSDHYYQPDASVAAIGIVDTIPDKSVSPANDFDHPVKVSASGGSVKGTTTNASASSVWYSFTPATSGLWKVRVSAADHNAYFRVHRAPTATDPVPGEVIASAYDNNTGQSFAPAKTVERLAPLRAGVTYLVEVIDYPGDSGAFTLSLAFASPLVPPANDDFAAATVITGRTGSITGDLRIATRQPEELGANFTNTNFHAYERTIWWRWTAPLSGRMRFTFDGAPVYSVLAIFSGNSLPTLNGRARGFSTYAEGTSAFLEVTEGETYFIRAGSGYPPQAPLALTWGPVGTLEQSIDFPELPAPAAGQTTLPLLATASSGLPVTYRLSGGSSVPAALEGNLLHFTGPGSVAVYAIQPGDDFYAPADMVTNYVTSPLPATSQSISFSWPGDRYVGSAPGHLLASATSGLPVEFEIVSGPATVAGNVLTVTGPGKVVVRARQPGDAIVSAAPPVEHTFNVLKAPTIPSLALARVTRVYNGRPQAVTAVTLPPGLNATYTYKSAKGPATATPPTDAGIYTVTATLDGTPRVQATGTLVIAKAPLTATGPARTRLVGQSNPPLTPITYSGFVNGENATVLNHPPVATTKASAKSTPGSYPITLSGGSDNNYAFSYVPGSLTVRGFGGSYEALLFDADFVALGKLELTVPANALAFTGVLTLVSEGSPIALRGSLAGSESPLSATGVWTRSTDGKAPLALSFRLAGDTLAGSLRLNEEDVLTIPVNGGARLYIAATKTVPPWSGAHTFLLRDAVVLDETDDRPLPLGSGHATAAIASSGGLTLKGQLADGTPLTASARLDVALRYRLLVKPYAKRPDSFLSGPLALEPHPDQIRFPGRLHAAEGVNLLVWAKTALPETTKASALDKTYREGFAVDALVYLDPWLPPVAASKTRPAITLAQRLGLPTEVNNEGDDTSLAPFTIAYDENVDLGEFEDEVPTEAMLGLNNRVSVGENPRRWTLTINAATGAFSGSFVLADPVDAPTKDAPAATKNFPRKVTFSGVLRQPSSGETDAPIGQGVFLLPALPNADSTEQLSGEIRLSAPGE